MSLTVELAPDIETALRAEAEKNGLEPEQLAAELIRERFAPSGRKPLLSSEEWLRIADTWAESHRHWPVLTEWAYERESFYEDRG